MATGLERKLRRRIRDELPARIFKKQPWRILWAIPLVGSIISISLMIVLVPIPWYLALACSIVLGNLYVANLFFGHESAHGGIVESERLQNFLLCFTTPIYLVSPHFWRSWHNRMHHANTNMIPLDPDPFSTVEEDERRSQAEKWLVHRILPGSRHWLSALYLFIAFTVHSQNVLWVKSKRVRFRGLNRRRAVFETVLIILFWIAMGAWAGFRGSFYAIIAPMVVANFVVMSYVTTNHMMSPLSDTHDDLSTTLGVRTIKFFDFIHLHFSHHLEHHLFPSLSHRYYPLIRDWFLRNAPEHYIAPPHWKALWVLYTTPKIYEGNDTLVNMLTGERLKVATLRARLVAASHSGAGGR